MARGVRHFVAAVAVLAAAAYLSLYGRTHDLPHFRSDGYSYYVYLPSALIYHDVTLEALADDWYGGRYEDYTGIRRWPSTGRWVNLHPIGTAILMAPLVVVADLLTVWSNLPRDGFSFYYQHAAALPAIVYLLLGLAILRRLLRRHFADGVVLATLICLTFGTNLFHYAVFDGTFSHVHAFFLVCVWLWLVERWWDRPTIGNTIAIGAVMGLNVLVRHTNGIYILLLPLYGIVRWADVRPRVQALVDRWRLLAVAARCRPRGAVAPTRALQVGDRIVVRQRLRDAQHGVLARVTAFRRHAVQHAERPLLLVARPVAVRRRRVGRENDGRAPWCCRRRRSSRCRPRSSRPGRSGSLAPPSDIAATPTALRSARR